MGGFVVRAHQQPFLHVVKPHIDAGHAEECPLCIPHRRDDADHHNVLPHQLIHIGIHDIRLPCLPDLLPVVLVIIVKGILVLFKYVSVLFLVRIHDRLVRHILFVNTVRNTLGIRYGILLKIGKSCRKPVAALEQPHQCRIDGISLLLRIQDGNIPERSGKTHDFPVGFLDVAHQRKGILVGNCRQFFPVDLDQGLCGEQCRHQNCKQKNNSCDHCHLRDNLLTETAAFLRIQFVKHKTSPMYYFGAARHCLHKPPSYVRTCTTALQFSPADDSFLFHYYIDIQGISQLLLRIFIPFTVDVLLFTPN